MRYGSVKTRGGGLFALLLAGVLALAAPQAARADAVKVGTAEALTSAIDNANGATTIELEGDIRLAGTLQVADGKDVTLTGGHSVTFSSDGSYATAGKGSVAVSVAKGGSLTLEDGVTLDGTGCGAKTALYSNGAVTLDGGSIANFSHAHGNRSLILSEGSNASFTITSGSIKNNDSSVAHPGGVLEVSKGARLTMSGGEISGNKAAEDVAMGAIVIVGISQYAEIGSGTNGDPAGTFEFTGGAISSNTAATTVYVGETNAALMPQLHNHEVTFANAASMTMSGVAEISGNTSTEFGGGVAVWGPGRFTMGGGTISGNTSPMGGGVAAVDTYSMGDLEHRVVRSDSQYGGVSLDEWSETRPAAFTLDGGTITGNKAESSTGQPVGAGVYVSSNEVCLKSGTISDNTAVSDQGSKGGQGGGVYVSALPYTLRLQNALVTDNTANELGGGLWLCPMGGAESHVKNGGAILGNNSKGAGDDVASLAKDREGADTGSSLSLRDRLLGNHRVDWYQDGAVDKAPGVLGTADAGVARYPTLKNKLGGVIEKNKDDLALKAVTENDTEALSSARSQAKLFITGNTAGRGGGIGSNGIVRFGDVPVVYPSVNVRVTKTWDDGRPADSHDPVNVTLVQYDAQGNSYDVAHATLGKDNGWTYTFTQTDDEDLLAKYGAYGEDHAAVATGRALTRYSIEEETPEGYESSSSAFTHEIEVVTGKGKGEDAKIEFALDLSQHVEENGVYTETFEGLDASGKVASGDAGDTVTFSNLPDTKKDGGKETAIDYRVRLGDKTNESFLDLSAAAGFNQLGDSATVTETLSTVLTNTAKASLSVTKEVEGGDAGDQQFTVQVSLKGDAGANVSGAFQATWVKDGQTVGMGEIEFNGGVATFQLGQGETVTIDGLPGGIEYDVTEVDIPSGYELAGISGGGTGTTAAPGEQTVTVTNRKTKGRPPTSTVDDEDEDDRGEEPPVSTDDDDGRGDEPPASTDDKGGRGDEEGHAGRGDGGLPGTGDPALPAGAVGGIAIVGLAAVCAGAVGLRTRR